MKLLRAPGIVGLFVIPIASMSWNVHRLGTAQERRHAEAATFHDASIQSREVARLRQMQQHVAERKRPEQDLIARIHDTLQQESIQVESHFRSLRSNSDSALPGHARYRRETVAVALDRLTVDQIGRFLLAWTGSQTLWTPVRIDLTHRPENAVQDQYDVKILLSATYMAEEEPS